MLLSQIFDGFAAVVHRDSQLLRSYLHVKGKINVKEFLLASPISLLSVVVRRRDYRNYTTQKTGRVTRVTFATFFNNLIIGILKGEEWFYFFILINFFQRICSASQIALPHQPGQEIKSSQRKRTVSPQ